MNDSERCVMGSTLSGDEYRCLNPTGSPENLWCQECLYHACNCANCSRPILRDER